MADDGYLQRARNLIETRRIARRRSRHISTPSSRSRAAMRDSRRPPTPRACAGLQELRAKFPALVEERRAGADANPLAAYAWLAFYCTHSGSRDDRSLRHSRAAAAAARHADRPAIATATCSGPESEPLDDPSRTASPATWRSPTGWLRSRRAGRQIEEVERLFGIAFKWRPRWPAVTAAIGNLAFGIRGKRAGARVLRSHDRPCRQITRKRSSGASRR